MFGLVFSLIFVILVVSALIYFKVAERFNIIDKPNERSSHTRVTLRGGGVIFFIGVVLYFLFFGYSHPLFFTGLVLIAGISFIDDIADVPSRYRIVVHFAAMMLMFYDCGFYVLPWYYTVIALIVGTGIINAWNFMDGINGITGGYNLVVIGSFWYVNNYVVEFIDNNFLYVIALALVVFNIFNFRVRARCFAGDVGSVTIAFIVVFLMSRLIIVSGNFSWIALLMVYGVDSVLTILYRLQLRENIFKAHRRHLYQLLANERGLPHPVVSVIYMVAQVVISASFIAMGATFGNFVVLAILSGSLWWLGR